MSVQKKMRDILQKRVILGGETPEQTQHIKRETDKLLRRRIAMGGEVVDLPYAGGAYNAWSAFLKDPAVIDLYLQAKPKYEKRAAKYLKKHAVTRTTKKKIPLKKIPLEAPKPVVLKRKTKVVPKQKIPLEAMEIPKPKKAAKDVLGKMLELEKPGPAPFKPPRKKELKIKKPFLPKKCKPVPSFSPEYGKPRPKREDTPKPGPFTQKDLDELELFTALLGPVRPPKKLGSGLTKISAKSKVNPWLSFVKKWQKANDPKKQMMYKDVLKMAAADYRQYKRGGVSAGKRNKPATRVKHKVKNPWLSFVKAWRAERDPEHRLPYKDVLQLAKLEYR